MFNVVEAVKQSQILVDLTKTLPFVVEFFFTMGPSKPDHNPPVSDGSDICFSKQRPKEPEDYYYGW